MVTEGGGLLKKIKPSPTQIPLLVELPKKELCDLEEVILSKNGQGDVKLSREDDVFVKSYGTRGIIWKFFPKSLRNGNGEFTISEDEMAITVITPLHLQGLRVSAKEIELK